MGRPESSFETRTMFRHHDAQLEAWKLAAATCGMTWQDWLRATLDAEAVRATHVPLVKRKAAR